MSDAQVEDGPLALEQMADCYGTWDQNFKDCTDVCEIREQCRQHTLAAAKPKPPTPPLEKEPELPEMEPKEYLLECLKGRYDLEVVENEKATLYRIRKNGNRVGRVMFIKNGMVEIRTSKVKLRMAALESAKQAGELFKALLIV